MATAPSNAGASREKRFRRSGGGHHPGAEHQPTIEPKRPLAMAQLTPVTRAGRVRVAEQGSGRFARRPRRNR